MFGIVGVELMAAVVDVRRLADAAVAGSEVAVAELATNKKSNASTFDAT